MKLDLDELARLASAATPGPWVSGFHGVGQKDAGRPNVCSVWATTGKIETETLNARFIASCSPERILRLIEIARAANGAQGALGQASFALRELLPNDPDAQMTVAIVEKAAADLRAALEGADREAPNAGVAQEGKT